MNIGSWFEDDGYDDSIERMDDALAGAEYEKEWHQYEQDDISAAQDEYEAWLYGEES
jgi:hypothetical protein